MNATQSKIRDKFAAELENLARRDQVPPGVFKALQELQTALNYQDPALIKSHLNAGYEAVRDTVRDLIRARLGLEAQIKETWKSVLAASRGCPIDHLDLEEIAKEFDSVINYHLGDLVSMRDGPIKFLEDAGYEVENSLEMKREIEAIEQLKDTISNSWPSRKALPPVNRKMLAESMACVARGEKSESVEEVIRRLSGNTAQ
jgi:hypothetical protein